MYWPLLLAAWYSFWGMLSNVPGFIGAPSGFRRPPLVGVYPFYSGFFSKRQGVSAKILEFWAKKIPPGRDCWRENGGDKTYLVTEATDVCNKTTPLIEKTGVWCYILKGYIYMFIINKNGERP